MYYYLGMEKKHQKNQQKQGQKPKHSDPFDLLLNKRIAVQIGPATIEGDLIHYDGKWLVLQSAVIIGTRYKAEVPLFIAPSQKVNFAHLLATKLEKLSEDS